MEQYGQLIDDTNFFFNEPQNPLYDVFAEYFENPFCVKMKSVDVYSMYICKVYCLLATSYRYLVLLVNEDKNTLGTKKRMRSLKWVSLQTRTLEENHDINPHSYQVKRGTILESEIIRTNVEREASTYGCEALPNLSVTLLHKKNGDALTYANKGTIVSALETYNTIVVLK